MGLDHQDVGIQQLQTDDASPTQQTQISHQWMQEPLHVGAKEPLNYLILIAESYDIYDNMLC